MKTFAKSLAVAFVSLLTSSGAWAADSAVLLKDLPEKTKVQLPADLVLGRGQARIEDAASSTLFGKDGKLLGNNSFYLPIGGLDRHIPKALVADMLKALQKNPKPGLYCFLNANLRKALTIDEKAIRIGARSFSVHSCFEKAAVTSSNGTMTTSVEFSFFGKTNRIAIHGCYLVDDEDADPANPDAYHDAYQLGCVAYHTNTNPTVADFLKALGLSRQQLVVSAPAASPEKPAVTAESRRPAPAAAPAAQNRDCPECRKAAAAKPSVITMETLDASQKWFDALLKRLPNVHSKEFKEWEAANPIGSMMHQKCVLESVTVSTNIAMQAEPVDAAMPASCVLFFDSWNAR